MTELHTSLESSPFLQGNKIAGKYRVELVLGTGGMGVVISARHEELDQRVAIKFLKPEVAKNENAAARFLREARAAARIQSDHVVKVYDVGTLDSGQAYIVMERLDGLDLGTLVEKEGALRVDRAVGYVIEALEALAHAHAAGIVHRDLKPANLFLSVRKDGKERIKVLDFGISKASFEALNAPLPLGTLTSADTLLGSPAYMSPEQVRNSKNVDHRSDMWSIGVILYELLLGRPPFKGETIGEVFASILEDTPSPIHEKRSDVPEALSDIAARCLKRKADERFADVGELACALAPFAGAAHAELARGVAALLDSLDADAEGEGKRQVVRVSQADVSPVCQNAETISALSSEMPAPRASKSVDTTPPVPMVKPPWLVIASGGTFLLGALLVLILMSARASTTKEEGSTPIAPSDRATAAAPEVNSSVVPEPMVQARGEPVPSVSVEAAKVPSSLPSAPSSSSSSADVGASSRGSAGAPSAKAPAAAAAVPGQVTAGAKPSAKPVSTSKVPANLLDGRD